MKDISKGIGYLLVAILIGVIAWCDPFSGVVAGCFFGLLMTTFISNG